MSYAKEELQSEWTGNNNNNLGLLASPSTTVMLLGDKSR
jgi:hypothetical protein